MADSTVNPVAVQTPPVAAQAPVKTAAPVETKKEEEGAKTATPKAGDSIAQATLTPDQGKKLEATA